MINCSKLINAIETKQEVEKYAGKEARSVPKHVVRYSSLDAPVVIWNITQKCNLACKHCHLGSSKEAAKDELSTLEARRFLDDLAALRVPMISVYGGEPLTRGDFFELASYAAQKNLRMILSTNATLINERVANEIRRAGISYVGIDLDGFAQRGGGIDVLAGLERAKPAIEHLRSAGIKHGVRVTVGDFNLDELPEIAEAIEASGITRFAVCQFFDSQGWRALREQRKKLMDFLFEYAKGSPHMEVVTEHVYADGVYIYSRLKQEHAACAKAAEELLKKQGGCPAGRKLINVDASGNVHPCMYWRSCTVGSIRGRKLGEILKKLRHQEGRCGACACAALCGGCRARAEKAFGDAMTHDPMCYAHETI